MGLSKTIWTNPAEFLRVQDPADPVLLFAPSVLQATARRFIDGFPGLVTYAVKSNPDEMVVQNLSAAGVRGFDVASPFEIRMIRRLAPDAALHYHNPVRSRAEIAVAVEHGVKSYSVDSHSELKKLAEMVPMEGTEISVPGAGTISISLASSEPESTDQDFTPRSTAKAISWRDRTGLL